MTTYARDLIARDCMFSDTSRGGRFRIAGHENPKTESQNSKRKHKLKIESQSKKGSQRTKQRHNPPTPSPPPPSPPYFLLVDEKKERGRKRENDPILVMMRGSLLTFFTPSSFSFHIFYYVFGLYWTHTNLEDLRTRNQFRIVFRTHTTKRQ